MGKLTTRIAQTVYARFWPSVWKLKLIKTNLKFNFIKHQLNVRWSESRKKPLIFDSSMHFMLIIHFNNKLWMAKSWGKYIYFLQGSTSERSRYELDSSVGNLIIKTVSKHRIIEGILWTFALTGNQQTRLHRPGYYFCRCIFSLALEMILYCMS